MLDRIFSDRTFRFTAPVNQSDSRAEPVFLNFDQLYLEALLSGTKTTGALKTKASRAHGWARQELELRGEQARASGVGSAIEGLTMLGTYVCS